MADDASGDDDQSFESCEQKLSSTNSPLIHSAQGPTEPSPSHVALAALSSLSVSGQDSEPSSPAATLSPAPTLSPAAVRVASVSEAPASVSSSGTNSSSASPAKAVQASADASDSASATRAADATDGTDDVDQGQIFDCFDLKIVYERGRTGFEDTKEIDFTPGMLIAVPLLLRTCADSTGCVSHCCRRADTSSFNFWTALCLAVRCFVWTLRMIAMSVSRYPSAYVAFLDSDSYIFAVEPVSCGRACSSTAAAGHQKQQRLLRPESG